MRAVLAVCVPWAVRRESVENAFAFISSGVRYWRPTYTVSVPSTGLPVCRVSSWSQKAATRGMPPSLRNTGCVTSNPTSITPIMTPLPARPVASRPGMMASQSLSACVMVAVVSMSAVHGRPASRRSTPLSRLMASKPVTGVSRMYMSPMLSMMRAPCCLSLSGSDVLARSMTRWATLAPAAPCLALSDGCPWRPAMTRLRR